MKMFHLTIGFVSTSVIVALCFIGCGGDGGSDECPALSVEDVVETEVIEQYHASFFPTENSSSPSNNPAVYVDFSDGITQACLADDNNKAVYEKFLYAIADDVEVEYFELSNDSLIPYSDSDKFAYFAGKGHIDADGKPKIGAPIDDAINQIVERDNVSVLITDGELYDRSKGEIVTGPWASEAFASWFSKGHELFIIYTDFEDTTNKTGPSFRKHMYIMFFVPKGLVDIRDKVVARLDEADLTYQKLSYSTTLGNMYERDYPNSNLPGAEKYIEFFSELDNYYRSDAKAFEFLDMASAGFNFSDEGLIYYLRDAGDENGVKKNFPLLDHLKFDFKNKLPNYQDLKLKLVVHDVYEDFYQWKKNGLARQNPPKVTKSIDGGDTLDPETNHLIFDPCMSTVDDMEPYDVLDKNMPDTVNSFASLLKSEFKYSQNSFNTEDKGIRDFLDLDTEAGWDNVTNEGLYEVVVSFSSKLNEANPYLNTTEPNLFRIDVVLDDASLNQEELNKEALTWVQMTDEGKVDQALYMSLKNVLEKNKPSGVLYSYYLKCGAFNNQ